MTDSRSAVWPAPAKLNLFLHVTGRRPDGYHLLQTLFQLIDLVDEIHIEVDTSGTIRRMAGDYGVAEADDLVVRAASLLQQHTGSQQGARIGVNKNIPLGAGLGGGSSDAATTLLVLNKLWNCSLDTSALARLGVSLGADVPVFIHGLSSLAAGIGEKLQPVTLGPRHYVLIFSPLEISTAEIFEHPELVRDSPEIGLAAALAGDGNNDCEAVVKKIHPEFVELFRDIGAWGRPRLTGTGSCVFLQMPDQNAAISAAREMKCRYNVRAVRGLDESPLHNLLGLTAGQ